jgi:ribosomal protein L5
VQADQKTTPTNPMKEPKIDKLVISAYKILRAILD